MSEGRLAAGVEAGSFLRRAAGLGGFGAVLQRGDAERGTLLLIVTERGEHRGILERRLAGANGYRWVLTGPRQAESSGVTQYLARVRRNDPDCWVLELDIPSSERFIAETIGGG
ncbi:MAG TPA: DUF1491 family protein [Sphingomicrobium sp.]|nr:DUF1491 family protein [Sphingomicrobium sp.]